MRTDRDDEKDKKEKKAKEKEVEKGKKLKLKKEKKQIRDPLYKSFESQYLNVVEHVNNVVQTQENLRSYFDVDSKEQKEINENIAYIQDKLKKIDAELSQINDRGGLLDNLRNTLKTDIKKNAYYITGGKSIKTVILAPMKDPDFKENFKEFKDVIFDSMAKKFSNEINEIEMLCLSCQENQIKIADKLGTNLFEMNDSFNQQAIKAPQQHDDVLPLSRTQTQPFFRTSTFVRGDSKENVMRESKAKTSHVPTLRHHERKTSLIESQKPQKSNRKVKPLSRTVTTANIDLDRLNKSKSQRSRDDLFLSKQGSPRKEKEEKSSPRENSPRSPSRKNK